MRKVMPSKLFAKSKLKPEDWQYFSDYNLVII